MPFHLIVGSGTILLMELQPSQRTSLQFRAIESAEDMKVLSELLDRSFPVLENQHFFDDFPIWNPDLTAKIPSKFFRLGGFDAGRLVCFAGVRIARLKTPGGPLPVALIGGVCTDSEYRGQQLASTLVAAALQWSAKQSVALAVLWGSEHALYERLGFELCGTQARIPLGSFVSDESPCSFQEGWTPGLIHCLSERPLGLEITPSDLPWISSHKNVRWFWTGPAAKPTAYAALGKGIDLPGLIHEWGGNSVELKRLLAAVWKITPDTSLLGQPSLMRSHGIPVPTDSVEFQCMIRIFDPSALLRSYDPTLLFSLVPKESDYLISVKDSPLIELTSREITRLIFGPGQFDKPFGEVFPLPLWLWGLDGA